MNLLAIAVLIALQQDPAPLRPPDEGSGLPWVDFEHLEIGARVGLSLFSPDFDADPEACFGLFFRAPVPVFGTDVTEPNPPEENPFAFGFSEHPPKAHLGVFAEILTSSITRDLDFLVEEDSGPIFFVGAGIDIAFIHKGPFVLRGQVGGQYGSFGSVSQLEDGISAMLGVSASIRLGRGFIITYNPHFNGADAGDSIWFHMIGLEADF